MSHIYNEYKVCTEPNTPVCFAVDNFYFFKILTAQSPVGRWSYGESWSIGTGGGGSYPSLVEDPDKGYATEKDAILAALDSLKRTIHGDIDWHRLGSEIEENAKYGVASFESITAKARKMLAEIERQQKNLTQPQVVQPSLFDNF